MFCEENRPFLKFETTCFFAAKLGPEKYKLGREEYRLGHEKYKLAREEYRLGREEYKLGHEEYRLGREKYKLAREKLRLRRSEARLLVCGSKAPFHRSRPCECQALSRRISIVSQNEPRAAVFGSRQVFGSARTYSSFGA